MLARRYAHGLAVAVVACAVAAWPSNARAQDGYDAEDEPAIVVSALGGAYSPLTHLDDAENVDFQDSWSVGGGAAYRINRHLALRGNFAFARAEVRDLNTRSLSAISGDKFNRYLYDADLQLRYPLEGGATPYAFIGGGGITIQRDLDRQGETHFTKGAGKVGVGLSYQLPRSDVGIFIEGTGWLYKWDRYGFDKTQFDTTVTGGLSYRFKL
jgi:hypothetical protein